MKKILVMLVAVCIAVSFGTAFAQTATLQASPTARTYWGPVFSTDTSGASAYVVSGAPNTDATIQAEGGSTLFAVANQATAGALFSRPLRFFSGATPIGSPALVSGTSTTVIVNMQAPTSAVVSGTDTGSTVYAINGLNGATIWQRGIASNGFSVFSGSLGLFDAAAAGTTPYSLAPLTIDNTNTGFSGATIYGISGGTNVGSASGVSIWAISAQTGNFTTVRGNNNVTGFTLTSNPNSAGVSVVHTSPVISGASLFVVGYSYTYSGSSIFQFDKNDIYSGIKKVALVNREADRSQQWIPTPTVSGSSLFVVDNKGGVSSYRTDNLSLNYSVRYTTAPITTGVTASPVTDDTYIVLCSTSGVTAVRLNNLSNLSTSTRQWYHEFSTSIPNAQIWTTPVISNGFVWVTVNSGTANSYTYRFTLSNNTNGSPQLVATYAGTPTFGDPIIVSSDLWSAAYNTVVTKTAATGANGNANWPQFKFDAAKTGENTAAAAVSTPAVDDDDSGCFISTIK